jgi:hypothetical protein
MVEIQLVTKNNLAAKLALALQFLGARAQAEA